MARKVCAYPLCVALRAKHSYLCVLHAKAQGKPKKGHKYHAKPTDLDGMRFDSKAEAQHYAELVMRQKAGEIRHLDRQPAFPLHANGSGRALGEYRGDMYYEVVETGARVVVDVKGLDTPLSKWKRRHCEAEYGITITVVSK